MTGATPAGELTDEVVVITGAATGIGAAIAQAVASEGAHVVVNHIGGADAEAAEAVVAGIRATGGEGIAVAADVRDIAALTAVRDRVHHEYGPVTALVNNAGVISRSSCVDMPEQEWDRVVDTSLRGTFLCCKVFGPDMIERRSGRIINIASELALTGERLLSHYCAAKAGVLGLTKALAREFIEHGVLVNAVAPGMTETPMLMANPITYNETTEASIPARRWGRPEEIAATVAFLLSPGATYYVGWTFSPNGGVVM